MGTGDGWYQDARTLADPGGEPTDEAVPTRGWPGRRTLVDKELDRMGPPVDLDGPAEGNPLPDGVRTRLERGFGTPLGDIRVHQGRRSAALAQDMNASAFAVGSDIHFGAGELNPDTRGGLRVLAHEVAHVLQARGASRGELAGGGPAPGHDSSEVDADGAARTVIAGGHASVAPVGGPLRIHAFQPHEHRDIGDDAGGGDLDLHLDDGSPLTFGEMTALADYIGDLDTIRSLAENPAGQLRLRWTLWFARVRGGDEPAYAGAAQARADWYKELANNGDHFGAAGREAYEQHHAQAMYDAYWEAFSPATGGGGMATEAFAQHFLQDAFAAGHIRTPRNEIVEFCSRAFPDSGSQILSHMVSYIANVIENETTTGKLLGGFSTKAEDAVRAQIVAKAGHVLQTMTLGHIISGALHDADNESLGVISDVDPSGAEVPGGYKWTAMGDAKLKDAAAAITRQMVVAAAEVSRLEVADLKGYGEMDARGPSKSEAEIDEAARAEIDLRYPYGAMAYFPRPDPDAGNTEYGYDFGADDGAMRGAIDSYLRSTVHQKLSEFVGSIPETQDIDGTTYHPRAAFQAFCDHLAAVGIGVLDDAVPKQAPHDPSYGTGQDD